MNKIVVGQVWRFEDASTFITYYKVVSFELDNVKLQLIQVNNSTPISAGLLYDYSIRSLQRNGTLVIDVETKQPRTIYDKLEELLCS